MKNSLFLLPLAALMAACGGAVTAPTVSLSSPSAQVFTNASVSLQVTVTGDLSSVELLKDGTLLATLTAPYQYTWDTTSQPEGTYNISARASKSGLAAPVVSAAQQITVDRTSPTITARTPTNAAVNVFLADEISLSFSEPMLPSSINTTTLQLQQSGSPIARNANLDAAGTKLMVVPTALPTLPANLSLVANGLTDRAGNVLNDTATFDAPIWQQPGTQPLDVVPARYTVTTSRSTALDANGNPMVVWTEYEATSTNVYAKRWNQTLNQWEAMGTQPLDLNSGKNASSISIAVDSSGKPFVTWTEDSIAFGFEVYVKSWNATTNQWEQLGGALDVSPNISPDGFVFSPRIAVDSSGKLFVAWVQIVLGSRNLYVKSWNATTSTWEQLGGTLDMNVTKIAVVPSIAIGSSGNPVVAWSETDAAGIYNIYVKSWNATTSTWDSIGSSLNVNTALDADVPSIAINSSGNPIVAWSEDDGTNSYNIYVKRWSATTSTWDSLGTTVDVDETKNAYSPSMVLNSSGNPIVAWSEYLDNITTIGNVFVKQWNATTSTWESIGTTTLNVDSANTTELPAIAINSSNKPVVAWQEEVSGNANIYVKRLNRIP